MSRTDTLALHRLYRARSSVHFATGRKVARLDFGFHNPFAAIWGVLDKDDILWLTGEHYESHHPLSYHITRIPRDVDWYANPSRANEIAELRCAGFTVNNGVNALALGIAAVSAHLGNGIPASSPAPAPASSPKPNSTAPAPTPAAAASRFPRMTTTTPSARSAT